MMRRKNGGGRRVGGGQDSGQNDEMGAALTLTIHIVRENWVISNVGQGFGPVKAVIYM